MKKFKIIPWWPVALFVVALTATALQNCNPKDEKKPPVVTPPPVVVVDTTKHLPDVVLEDTSMDRKAKEELLFRRRPPKPKPGDPPLPPPVIDSKKACVLLDFNGHFVSGTLWNTNGDINCATSGLDDFKIATVFATIKNYFSFDNDSTVITMDESIYYAYPQNKRIRCVFTTTNPFGTGMGGIAYINSLTWFNEAPCFVFTNLLGFNLKNISDAGAHEPGHAFGCRHHSSYDVNCVKVSEYFWGDDIMGASYNHPAPNFGTGPSSLCCTCFQDSKKVIRDTRRL